MFIWNYFCMFFALLSVWIEMTKVQKWQKGKKKEKEKITRKKKKRKRKE